MNYFNESIDKVNIVLKTSDLTIFKQMRGNRPPNPQHIRRLCDSIKTHGILQNPIIVNEKFEVIDGQHRLLAAQQANSSIYYILIKGYGLNEVHTLNLNQKNWTKKEFMEGYADMGIHSYVKLREFLRENKEFNIRDCIAMCNNTLSSSSTMISSKYRKHESAYNRKEIFEEGTWKGKDFDLAQENANKIKMIKPLYSGYRRSVFIGAMLGLFKNDNFVFSEFVKKLKIQPNKMEDCTNVAQQKALIEEIYNYRRREKVNLRF